MQNADTQCGSHIVLTNKDIEFLHNELVSSAQAAGFTNENFQGQDIRSAFIIGFARAIEAAVLTKIGPAMTKEIN